MSPRKRASPSSPMQGRERQREWERSRAISMGLMGPLTEGHEDHSNDDGEEDGKDAIETRSVRQKVDTKR